MKKILESLKKSGMLGVVIGITVVLIIAMVAFLGKGGTEVSGWEILMNQTFNEWFWMVLASVIAGLIVYAYIRYYRKTQDTKGITAFAAGFMIFVAIAFGKGCTDKANEGVTSGKGRPGKTKPADENRIPAEDLLPKK